MTMVLFELFTNDNFVPAQVRWSGAGTTTALILPLKRRVFGLKDKKCKFILSVFRDFANVNLFPGLPNIVFLVKHNDII